MSEAPEVDPADLQHLTEASISAGRKKQLEQYEPINEQATLTVDLPEGASGEEKKQILAEVSEAAWAQCERDVQLRYEQHTKKETFGDE